MGLRISQCGFQVQVTAFLWAFLDVEMKVAAEDA